MPETKAKSATRAKAEADRSVLLAIADEINTLSALLRCQPSLSEATQLVRMVRDQESPSQRDRLAELAHALFGEDLEGREFRGREEEAPCDTASDLIGVEDAVNACVIWRLERLSRFLGLRIAEGRPRRRRK